jgi:hypothetical protein
MDLSLSINMCNPSGVPLPPHQPLLVLGKKGVVRSLKGWGLSFPAARWGCTRRGLNVPGVPAKFSAWLGPIYQHPGVGGVRGGSWSVNLSSSSVV